MWPLAHHRSAAASQQRRRRVDGSCHDLLLCVGPEPMAIRGPYYSDLATHGWEQQQLEYSRGPTAQLPSPYRAAAHRNLSILKASQPISSAEFRILEYDLIIIFFKAENRRNWYKLTFDHLTERARGRFILGSSVDTAEQAAGH